MPDRFAGSGWMLVAGLALVLHLAACTPQRGPTEGEPPGERTGSSALQPERAGRGAETEPADKRTGAQQGVQRGAEQGVQQRDASQVAVADGLEQASDSTAGSPDVESGQRAVDLDEIDLSQFGLEGVDLENMTLDDLATDDPNPLGGCLQCHTDVGDRYQGSRHEKEDVTCADCHGPSEGHLADENNQVKPDETFAREDVDHLCGDCHDCSRTLPADWASRPQNERPVCTDCHGSHALRRIPIEK